MSSIRFFTDEDVYAELAASLRRRGYDTVSARETGRLGLSDDAQLDWSVANNRAIITFNVAHFVAIHSHWMQQSRNHFGVIVSDQRPLGEILRRVIKLGENLSAEQLRNRLEYLNNW